MFEGGLLFLVNLLSVGIEIDSVVATGPDVVHLHQPPNMDQTLLQVLHYRQVLAEFPCKFLFVLVA